MKKRMVKGFGILFIVGMLSVIFFANNVSANKKATIQNKEEQKKVDSRATLRAFYTAPPIIPHEVDDQRDPSECLYCHKEVKKIGKRKSMKTPHPEFSNCFQCHVQGNLGNLKGGDSIGSLWEGLQEPKKGSRAHEAAPPTIPHRLFLRKNCLSCHGPKNPNEALRTTHPERSNCMQCHVQQKDRQF